MPDGTKWGIYAVTEVGTNPTLNTLTGTGQVTLVAPLGFTIVDFNPVSGLWQNNAVINGPTENPTKSYISFGLINDTPQILYSPTAPTLLFTFRKALSYCPDEFYLIENNVDPFDQLPNSVNSNPGNELTVLDFGANPPTQYAYGKNVAPYAWDCHDCDGDGIVNAFEDTNGNGVYDAGIDASDLCDGQGGGCQAITAANLRCETGGTACGNNPGGSQIALAVDITGGAAPFTVKYTDGSSTFILTNYQSGTPFNVPATNGATYHIESVVGNDGCEAAAGDLSGIVPVVVSGALSIVSQPEDATVCYTESTSFDVCASATNGSFTIRWEYSANQGATWLPVNFASGAFSESTLVGGCTTLSVNNVNGLNGYRFRAVAESATALPAISQAAVLNVQGLLQLGSNPTDVNVCAGETVVFNANFINLGAGNITYMWELSHNNGATWWDGMPGPGISGIFSEQLTMQNIEGIANGDIYRLRAHVNGCQLYYTQPAKLRVEGPVEIEALISPVSVCRGEEACFEVQASTIGAGQLLYQWQQKAAGSATWADIQGANSAVFCLASTEGRNGYCYRAVVRTENCSAEFSSEACLTVEDKAVFAQQPQNATICVGETVSFAANASIEAGYAGSVSYQWQGSADGGQTWLDLDNDQNFEGVTEPTLTVLFPALASDMKYRLSAATGICEATYSEAASVIVEGPVEFAQQPDAMAICPGMGASFTASAINLGEGSLHYQWQASTNGIDWADVAESANYAGTQTSTLTVQSANNSRQFRLSAQAGSCQAVYSAAANLAVEAPIVFTEQPASLAVCPDETASFTAKLGSGSSALSLQWQSSPNGQDWTNLAASSIFSGVNSTTLNIAAVAGLEGLQFRLVAASQNCEANSTPAVLSLEDEAICNPAPTYQDCVTLAVKKLDGNIGWSVWVKADSSFTETPYQLPTSGRITLVAPVGFAMQGLTSFNGGQWKPGKVYMNPPQDPGKVYVEFNLTPNQNFLELTPGGERLLFSFSVVNGCPSSLSLMDAIIPAGFSRNEFAGFGGGLTAENIPFHVCGIYGQETWQCPTPLSMVSAVGGNTVENSQSMELDPSDIQVDFNKAATQASEPTSFFGVAPNPVRETLTVSLGENTAGKPGMLRLLNLQGQLVMQAATNGETTHRFDMTNTIPGFYFLTLEVDGKVVEREKIIVQ